MTDELLADLRALADDMRDRFLKWDSNCAHHLDIEQIIAKHTPEPE